MSRLITVIYSEHQNKDGKFYVTLSRIDGTEICKLDSHYVNMTGFDKYRFLLSNSH